MKQSLFAAGALILFLALATAAHGQTLVPVPQPVPTAAPTQYQKVETYERVVRTERVPVLQWVRDGDEMVQVFDCSPAYVAVDVPVVDAWGCLAYVRRYHWTNSTVATWVQRPRYRQVTVWEDRQTTYLRPKAEWREIPMVHE